MDTQSDNQIIITTTDNVPGYEIVEVYGLVRGSTVRARNLLRDYVAGFRNMVGGEITGYTQLQAEAREQALARMKQDALRFSANAVVGTKMVSATLGQGMAEIVLYGTAVRLEKRS